MSAASSPPPLGRSTGDLEISTATDNYFYTVRVPPPRFCCLFIFVVITRTFYLFLIYFFFHLDVRTGEKTRKKNTAPIVFCAPQSPVVPLYSP